MRTAAMLKMLMIYDEWKVLRDDKHGRLVITQNGVVYLGKPYSAAHTDNFTADFPNRNQTILNRRRPHQNLQQPQNGTMGM